MSFTIAVPVSVPSVLHNSFPCMPSSATKYVHCPAVPKNSGDDDAGFEDRLMSLTRYGSAARTSRGVANTATPQIRETSFTRVILQLQHEVDDRSSRFRRRLAPRRHPPRPQQARRHPRLRRSRGDEGGGEDPDR